MAVPGLPVDEITGQVWGIGKVNAVIDHLQWWRDTRPLFKGQMNTTEVDPETLTEIVPGATASTFANTPTHNIGGWTVSATPNSIQGFGLVVPEDGLYEGFWNVQMDTSTTGYRIIQPLMNGQKILGARLQIDSTAGQPFWNSAPFTADLKAGGTMSCQVWHNTTAPLTTTTWLSVKWIQSA